MVKRENPPCPIPPISFDENKVKGPWSCSVLSINTRAMSDAIDESRDNIK